MDIMAVLWHMEVERTINGFLAIFAVVLGVAAFIHCATQRADAFAAIGTLQKPAWLAIIGVTAVMAGLTFGMLLFALVAITAAALYLLDVRPGLKDAANGGSW